MSPHRYFEKKKTNHIFQIYDDQMPPKGAHPERYRMLDDATIQLKE